MPAGGTGTAVPNVLQSLRLLPTPGLLGETWPNYLGGLRTYMPKPVLYLLDQPCPVLLDDHKFFSVGVSGSENPNVARRFRVSVFSDSLGSYLGFKLSAC